MMRSDKLRTWTFEPLSYEVGRALEKLARTDGVVAVAVMPDVHLAHDVCIGTVVATERLLFPAAVGGCIGCGMAAIAFDADADVLERADSAARLLGGLSAYVPILGHCDAQALGAMLADGRLSAEVLERKKLKDGSVQLGTLGRGNHFLEFQRDDENRLWLMVHSGSRGMGQAIRDHHLTKATRTNTGLLALEAGTPESSAYLNDVDWALEYARENRRRLLDAAVLAAQGALGIAADMSTLFGCHHNHLERVEADGSQVWLHRKGAISARENEPGIIPGSMGSESFHVEGRGCASALWSASHGAGRVMSRSEARRRIPPRQLRKELEGVWYDHRQTSRLVDEAPSAYKDISKVMKAQASLTKIVRRLRPVLSYKGS